MSVTPQTLPSIDSSGHWHGTYEYRWRSSSTNSEIYGLWHLNDNAWADANALHAIEVTSANVWQDAGSENPSVITENTDGTVDLNKETGNNLFLYAFTKPTTASWLSSGGGTGTEGVNAPYVTWGFPHRNCGETTYVSVTHTVAQSVATTYYVHELGVGQIGTILVGTGAYPSTSGSANYAFTISARTLQVKDANGSLLGTKVFDCSSRKKVHSNFW